MNFQKEFKKGQLGQNRGLSLGESLLHIEKAINGTQKGKLFGVAGAPKSGKSTFVNYAFILQPYLQKLKEPLLNIEWIYYLLETNRVAVEFDFVTFFLNNEYGIKFIKLEDNLMHKGSPHIELSPDYLRGILRADDDSFIKIDDTLLPLVKEVYTKHVVPLCGHWDESGNLLKKGMITFVTNAPNPTGMFFDIRQHAENYGEFVYSGKDPYKKIIGYTPKDPNKYTIVILDHLRKIIPEKDVISKKQIIDKTLEYQVQLRNLIDYTFIDIIHLNRSLTESQRMRQFGDMLYPTSDSIKDSANLSEDCDYVFTLFSPNDDRYNLSQHFGLPIKDGSGNPIYPNLKTIHLVESRHCVYPQHFRVLMEGNLKNFKSFKV